MLVTALSPLIGYDRASKIAHYAIDNDLTLKAAALKLGFVTEHEFDRIVDPEKMVNPDVDNSSLRVRALNRTRISAVVIFSQPTLGVALALTVALPLNHDREGKRA